MSHINKHVKTKDHALESDICFSNVQPSYRKIGSAVEFSNKPLRVKVSEAECIWAFKVAEEDLSFTANDNTKTLFQQIFHGEASEKCPLGQTKILCVERHGLSEVLSKELVDDINNSIGTVV